MVANRRYAAKGVGKKSSSAFGRKEMAATGKKIFPRHTIGGAMTRAFATKKSGTRMGLTKYTLAATRDTSGNFTTGIGKFKYSRKSAMFEPTNTPLRKPSYGGKHRSK